jgi:hypothetical protein
MPYDNKLNREIAERLKKINEKYIEHYPYSYDVAESNLGFANKMRIDDRNINQVRNELEEREGNLPDDEDDDFEQYELDLPREKELTGGSLASHGAFARGTFRDTGYGSVQGAGFFDDVFRGIKSVVKPASQILSLIPHPYAQTASTGLNVASNLLGNAKAPKAPKAPRKQRAKKEQQSLLLKRNLEGGKPNKEDVGIFNNTLKAKRGRPNKMKGGVDLGEAHNMIKPDGTTGNGKPKRQIGGQKIVPVAQMHSSTMSGLGKRSDIVKKIMKERGVNMTTASSIVKSEGLYKAKK